MRPANTLDKVNWRYWAGLSWENVPPSFKDIEVYIKSRNFRSYNLNKKSRDTYRYLYECQE